MDPESEDMLTSKRFLSHAAYMLEMIDTALGLLGPDIELLEEMLLELGVKHIRYGVNETMFPHMGVALVETLEKTLNDNFTSQMKEAWTDTYDALAGDMIQAQKNAKSKK